jgi:hypothetical protein
VCHWLVSHPSAVCAVLDRRARGPGGRLRPRQGSASPQSSGKPVHTPRPGTAQCFPLQLSHSAA